jgi:elongation factor 1 alpha-like protein
MKRFNAQIVVMDPQVPLIQGSRLLLHYHAISQPVIITKLSCIIDKATGEVLKEKPRVIGKSQVAKVEIMVDESKAICLETFKDCKELGRFLLRRQGKTVAAGIILDQVE